MLSDDQKTNLLLIVFVLTVIANSVLDIYIFARQALGPRKPEAAVVAPAEPECQVCPQGPPGVSVIGPPGQDGRNGLDGKSGRDGFNSLLETAQEGDCVRIRSGIDYNRNGVLDHKERSNDALLCVEDK